MENEINYHNIDHLLDQIPDNFQILEETINIDVQKQYIESSQKLELNGDLVNVDEQIAIVENPDSDDEEIKIALQNLAFTDAIEAFRAIESYTKTAPDHLKDWATLALQQSRILIHASLLDEQQFFISSGLGGKKDKLRYFFIFPFANNLNITDFQRNSFEKELNYFLEKYDSILEDLNFEEKFATVTALVPLKSSVADIVNSLINECKNYGNYLSDNAIITNIKKFNTEEITEIIENNEE
ncbi:MAG TPA: hypothetical protein PLS94_02380 [Prolixibacteraceae bacterium]|nr:hypothetical protein [Prolixibacteraceae bacterium]HPR60622.1 hypothetical protein [Prolixibacteraceae bacterium]